MLMWAICILVIGETRGFLAAQEAPATVSPLGTGFMYQGMLKDKSVAANGQYDFQFGLYDAVVVGNRLGSIQTIEKIAVTNGLFSVELNTAGEFGTEPFNGDARWLEIAVKKTGTTSYSTLTPRSPVTVAPYAHYAKNAWKLNGNAGTSADTNFVGTTDNQPLVLRANNFEILRLEGLRAYAFPVTRYSANVTAGVGTNFISDGVWGGTVGGGGYASVPCIMPCDANRVTDDYGTVSGGISNQAGNGGTTTTDAAYATVSGGSHNMASGSYATVAGGSGNTASGAYSFAAGLNANAIHEGAFVWGDDTDAAITSTTNNQFLARTTGGVRFILSADISDGGGFRQEPAIDYCGYQSPNWIGGAGINQIGVGVRGAFIGGGGCWIESPDMQPSPSASEKSGPAKSAGPPVPYPNKVIGDYGVVCGGIYNVAGKGECATVGGGSWNSAIGYMATVPGGSNNQAVGNYSFVAGHNARADHQGCFVWGDNSVYATVDSTADNQFIARSAGGVWFYTNSGLTSGARLNPGANAWSSVSDRNAKENFAPVKSRDLLEKLEAIPIETWNYKSQDRSIRHIGPMAQDFHKAFGVGEDNKHISTIDAEGVALAAIQGLYQVIKEKDAEIAGLKSRIGGLETEIGTCKELNRKLDMRLMSIEALMGRLASQTNANERQPIENSTLSPRMNGDDGTRSILEKIGN